jgi:hypothetical protein
MTGERYRLNLKEDSKKELQSPKEKQDQITCNELFSRYAELTALIITDPQNKNFENFAKEQASILNYFGSHVEEFGFEKIREYLDKISKNLQIPGKKASISRASAILPTDQDLENATNEEKEAIVSKFKELPLDMFSIKNEITTANLKDISDYINKLALTITCQKASYNMLLEALLAEMPNQTTVGEPFEEESEHKKRSAIEILGNIINAKSNNDIINRKIKSTTFYNAIITYIIEIIDSVNKNYNSTIPKEDYITNRNENISEQIKLAVKTKGLPLPELESKGFNLNSIATIVTKQETSNTIIQSVTEAMQSVIEAMQSANKCMQPAIESVQRKARTPKVVAECNKDTIQYMNDLKSKKEAKFKEIKVSLQAESDIDPFSHFYYPELDGETLFKTSSNSPIQTVLQLGPEHKATENPAPEGLSSPIDPTQITKSGSNETSKRNVRIVPEVNQENGKRGLSRTAKKLNLSLQANETLEEEAQGSNKPTNNHPRINNSSTKGPDLL